MRNIHKMPVYHNAFYVQSQDELKLKKDSKAGSFSIRIENGQDFEGNKNDKQYTIARSYNTDIAIIDNTRKLMLRSWHNYSHTTAGQLLALERAMPGNYTMIYVAGDIDNIVSARGYMNEARVDALIIAPARADAHCYLFDKDAKKIKVNERTADNGIIVGKEIEVRRYRVADRNDWQKYENNAEGSIKSYFADSRSQVINENKQRYVERPRPSRQEVQSKRLQEKIAKYNKLIASGTPAMIARHKTNYIADCNNCSHVFLWSGNRNDAIKTSGGIKFSFSQALTMKNFERFLVKGRKILDMYEVMNIERGDTKDKDVFVIGCHRITRAELTSLRELVLGCA